MRFVSLAEVLGMYEQGIINSMDFMTVMLGLLDVHPPEELFARTPPEMRPYFMERARDYVVSTRELMREGVAVLNCMTDEPLPEEALRRMFKWFDSKGPA